jgi:hypothetical protein
MVENEKNPTQLTEEDLFIVDQIFIACVAIYYHCMETYKTPKAYAQQYLVKKFKSKKYSQPEE